MRVGDRQWEAAGEKLGAPKRGGDWPSHLSSFHRDHQRHANAAAFTDATNSLLERRDAHTEDVSLTHRST
jgi:hypothetical protein